MFISLHVDYRTKCEKKNNKPPRRKSRMPSWLQSNKHFFKWTEENTDHYFKNSLHLIKTKISCLSNIHH